MPLSPVTGDFPHCSRVWTAPRPQNSGRDGRASLRVFGPQTGTINGCGSVRRTAANRSRARGRASDGAAIDDGTINDGSSGRECRGRHWTAENRSVDPCGGRYAIADCWRGDRVSCKTASGHWNLAAPRWRYRSALPANIHPGRPNLWGGHGGAEGRPRPRTATGTGCG